MTRRLIEEAFPLKKVSEDSKHEKNVRHGHISTLHIWPARRPLAAARAAIIAALLPDPGDEKKRDAYTKKIENITRWKSENGPDLEFFRQEIRKAYGGRAPRILDMFAGGGAIPLEAMRLGCDVTAIDYNPVAWFLLKCTLEFPQRLAGQTWVLPKANPTAKPREQDENGSKKHQDLVVGNSERQTEMNFGAQQGDLAAHVRYWGNWVLERARLELAQYYPTMGGKTTFAYLWARTVPCQDPKCGGSVPLLKTLWLCKKENKRRALRLIPNLKTREIEFEIWEPDSKDQVGEGTVSGNKAFCLLHPEPLPLSEGYIKACGNAGKMGSIMTAVVVDGNVGKEYRLPTDDDVKASREAAFVLNDAAAKIPYGLPTEQEHKNPRTLIVQLYGMNTWDKLFTSRQLLSMATFVKHTRLIRDEMVGFGYPPAWVEIVAGYLGLAVSRMADRSSTICHWSLSRETIQNTFSRFALAMSWDFSEANLLEDSSGGYPGQFEWITKFIEHSLQISTNQQLPKVVLQSATEFSGGPFDAIVTDPPYYNAIPYADLSDFFYVWLRRTIGDIYPLQFETPLTPKVGELALRLPHTDIPNEHTPKWYEAGMATVFSRAFENLKQDGRVVMVFAHKDAEAWETLVSSMIQTGFVVTASWPIDTEMRNRTRAQTSAALASSIWMVCRKRDANAGIGRYTRVKEEMQERITERLRYFWDQGISGPDFVWAAVGPALESYSSYEQVRRMDGTLFTVHEFLKEVRRLVTDFALGRILHGASTEGLDEWTRYYLMHRSSFGLALAPVGECILLAGGYGLDLNDLKGARGFLGKGKAKRVVEPDEEAGDASVEVTETAGSGSEIRLLTFEERKRDDLGEPHSSGGLPMIDMLHRLMRLWQAGDTEKLNTYVQEHGLAQNELFWSVAQAILEMSEPKSKERTLLEALVAWGRGKGAQVQAVQARFD